MGIDLRSGCCHAEGSSALWDELCAFQGLDDRDLENWASVVLYLEACKRIEPIR